MTLKAISGADQGAARYLRGLSALMLGDVTTMTDDPSGRPPLDPPPPPAAAQRRLRRSVDDRVLGGVAGGLGSYFSLDPVLFRVLFATTAVFGGIGALVYVLAWALIPDQDAVDPLADRIVEGLRIRKIPLWLAAAAVGILLWAGFRQQVPWGIGPVVIAGVMVAVALSRRTDPAGPPSPPDGAPVDVAGTTTEPQPGQEPPAGARSDEVDAASAARVAARDSARQAARERRHRTAPMRWGAFGALVISLGVVAAVDASRGVPMAAYGWTMLAVSVGALVVGGMTRRTPWLNAVWAVLAVAILVVFGASHARLRDGTGDRLLAPHSSSALPNNIRLAIGRTTLDLTNLSRGAGAGRVVHVRQGAGTVVVRVTRGSDVTVTADVHLGSVAVDGNDQRSGLGESTTGASGPNVLTIDVQLAVGVVEVDHVNA
jgi:phage shock protein PspC (stress-responsive transcriptional regulator)